MELKILSKEISQNLIDRFKQEYNGRKEAKVIERTVTKNGILNSSRNLAADVQSTPVFSIDLDTGDVANQKQSGRCWMFAALNTMRHDMKNQFKVPGNFELSQNYTFFWDKFEKSNWFYENIINTAELDTDDRKVAFLLNEPQGDGGQWDMLCALIEKYGVVPQSAYPETYNSSKSREFDTLLNEKLRKDAVTLRNLVNSGQVVQTLMNVSNKCLVKSIAWLLTVSENHLFNSIGNIVTPIKIIIVKQVLRLKHFMISM